MSFERWPTVSGSTYLVTATASSSANTKGSYAQITASTTLGTSDWYAYVEITSTNRAWLTDIATGAAASEVVQIANIPVCNNGQGSTIQVMNAEITANSDIAASTRIAARCQSSGTGTQSVQVYVMLNLNGTAGLAAPITSGVSTGTSKATSVDAGSVANTKGSYAQLDASLASTVGLLQIIATFLNSGPSFGTFALDIATGGSGSEVVLIPDIGLLSDNALTILQPTRTFVSTTITSSTRIAARSQSSITDATDRVISVAMISSPALASGGTSGGAWASA